METIQGATGGGDGGDGGGGADPGAGDDSASGVGMSTADKLRMGGSAISALSSFGLAQSKATQMATEATQQRMAASEDYIQASEKQNAISKMYQETMGAQLTTAAASNVDIASGSVVNAQQQAQTTADQESRKIRLSAQMNADQRMASYYALKQASGVQRLTSWLNLGGDAAKMAAQAGAG